MCRTTWPVDSIMSVCQSGDTHYPRNGCLSSDHTWSCLLMQVIPISVCMCFYTIKEVEIERESSYQMGVKGKDVKTHHIRNYVIIAIQILLFLR